MNWLGVSYWGHRNMGGPARRVVEYNFEHYRKRGWVGRLLFAGKGLSGKWLHPWKDSPMSKNIEEGTRHGFLCLIFLQKENSIVQFAMRIFRKFCQIHFGRGGVALLRNAGLGVQKLVASCFYLTGVGVGHSSVWMWKVWPWFSANFSRQNF